MFYIPPLVGFFLIKKKKRYLKIYSLESTQIYILVLIDQFDGALSTISFFHIFQSRIELESYKSEIITKLAEKLQAYLYSSRGREDILNPPHKQIICEVSYRSLDKEVPARVQSGIQRWCEGQEVKAIIDDADAKMKSTVEEIESQLQEIEIEMTGIYTRVEDSTGAVILGLGLGLGFLFFTIFNSIYICVCFGNCSLIHSLGMVC